jgi:hypothetical protein
MKDNMKLHNEEIRAHWSNFYVGIVVLAAFGAGAFIVFRFLFR